MLRSCRRQHDLFICSSFIMFSSCLVQPTILHFDTGSYDPYESYEYVFQLQNLNSNLSTSTSVRKTNEGFGPIKSSRPVACGPPLRGWQRGVTKPAIGMERDGSRKCHLVSGFDLSFYIVLWMIDANLLISNLTISYAHFLQPSRFAEDPLLSTDRLPRSLSLGRPGGQV